MSLTRNPEAVAALAKSLAFGPADRVFQNAKKFAADRFPVSFGEADTGYQVFVNGEEAMFAEYGQSPEDVPDRWATRAVMEASDGRP